MYVCIIYEYIHIHNTYTHAHTHAHAHTNTHHTQNPIQFVMKGYPTV